MQTPQSAFSLATANTQPHDKAEKVRIGQKSTQMTTKVLKVHKKKPVLPGQLDQKLLQDCIFSIMNFNNLLKLRCSNKELQMLVNMFPCVRIFYNQQNRNEDESIRNYYTVPVGMSRGKRQEHDQPEPPRFKMSMLNFRDGNGKPVVTRKHHHHRKFPPSSIVHQYTYSFRLEACNACVKESKKRDAYSNAKDKNRTWHN